MKNATSALASLALAAGEVHAAGQPANWDAGIASPTAKNLSHDPHVVEVSIDASVTQLEVRPGMWMFHCHILDHTGVGMMGMVHLE